MLQKMIAVYVFFFARARFERLNKLLYRLSLAGLGILNYKTSKVSGEKSFLKEYLESRNGILIDVGANQGNYSLEAVSVNQDLKVYAFEPHPITFSFLSRNTSHNPNVIPINKGMSSKDGILKLYDYPGNDGSSHASLFQEVITEIHREGSAVAHEVEVITLDGFLKETGIDEVVLLKIDVEGNELEILRGGRNSIAERRIKAIHFEFNEMNVVSRAFFKDFWKALEAYRFYRLLPNDMLEIKAYNPLNCEIFAYQNIVAILKD